MYFPTTPLHSLPSLLLLLSGKDIVDGMVFKARFPLPEFTAGRRVHFLTPELTGVKNAPELTAVNSGRELG